MSAATHTRGLTLTLVSFYIKTSTLETHTNLYEVLQKKNEEEVFSLVVNDMETVE